MISPALSIQNRELWNSKLSSRLLRDARKRVHNIAAFRKGPAMDDSAMVFAAVFLVGVALLCGLLFLWMLHRISTTSEARRNRRKSSRRAAMSHRAFKDVM